LNRFRFSAKPWKKGTSFGKTREWSINPVSPEGGLLYVINLKQDPFERLIHARGYDEWAENRSWVFGPAGAQIAKFVGTFKEYPPSQKSMSVQVSNISQAINAQVATR